MALAGSAIATFVEDGFLAPVDILSPEEIEFYLGEFERLEAQEGRERCISGIQDWHFSVEPLWRLATHPRIVDTMRELAGEDLLLGGTRFFVKYPRGDEGEFFTWHQDATFWGLEPPTAFTCFVALDPCTPESGCLRVIPGSHHRGLVPHRRSPEVAGNMLRRAQEIPPEHVRDDEAVDVALEPGQMSVHDARLFHASGANRSERRRCSFTAVYIPPSVAHGREFVVAGEFEDFEWRRRRVVLVSGADTYGHFDIEPMPFPLPGP